MMGFPRCSSKVRGICGISVRAPGGGRGSFAQADAQHCPDGGLVWGFPSPWADRVLSVHLSDRAEWSF